jgi:ribosome maturation factor RimP
MSGEDGHRNSVRFVREVGIAAAVANLAEPVLSDMGFRLVRVHVSGGDGPSVQVMAERADGTISIEDCEAISRQLSAVLDVHEPMSASYRLEISSPGIDRPLVRPSDFEDWAGHEARVELKEPVGGRRRFRGTIEGLEGDEARIVCDVEGHGRQVLGFPVALIGEAKLVLTDELIREALRRGKKAASEREHATPSTGSGDKQRGKRRMMKD